MKIYNRVKNDVDSEGDTLEGDFKVSLTANELFNYRSIFIGVIFGFILNLVTYEIISMSSENDSCTRKLSIWSPALSIFNDEEISVQRFVGALRTPNKFRGPPSPEIDDAWDEITYPEGGLVRISKEQLERINASEYAAEYTEEMGGGYIAGVEVFHQIHCLNMIRKATYLDYYLPRNAEWERDPDTMRYHIDHCIDMLRQKLMCDPDVGMITYVWAKDWKQPLPDFNTVHMCRSYSKVINWAQENFVHNGNVSDIERAPGALELGARP
ncbi:hypothetical protein EAF04_008274 [Stromatinia cepivora]|nr:hypothetical protein EAF04_008274 [Stromatinia cepivora]